MQSKAIVIMKHPRFFTRFYYDSTTNIMGENLYERFGLPKGIVVHKNLTEKLYSLVPVLEHFNYKLMLTDVFRPVEMQKYLYDNWEARTGKPPKSSLATMQTAPHARGIAFDCKLTDTNENPIPLPSSSIKFNSEQRNPDFEFSNDPEEQIKKRNRNLLRYMMLCAGISPINKEWFHFQLPESEKYEPITVEETKSATEYPFPLNEEFKYYDIFHEYQNDEYEGKTHFWINNERYFEQFKKIGLEEFLLKLEKICHSS